jgi:AcrR family transcriptional regulator
VLEGEGREALTMRRIAAEIGVQAPSLYKHFPDKRSLEAAVIAEGLAEFGAQMSTASGTSRRRVKAVADAYRHYALAHPHLYHLMTDGELPRDLLPLGIEDAAAAPILAVLGTHDRARAGWATAHGLVSLELAHRFPPDADIAAAWKTAVRMLEGDVAARRRREY